MGNHNKKGKQAGRGAQLGGGLSPDKLKLRPAVVLENIGASPPRQQALPSHRTRSLTRTLMGQDDMGASSLPSLSDPGARRDPFAEPPPPGSDFNLADQRTALASLRRAREKKMAMETKRGGLRSSPPETGNHKKKKKKTL